MKYVALVGLVALTIILAGCQQTTTGPQVSNCVESTPNQWCFTESAGFVTETCGDDLVECNFFRAAALKDETLCDTFDVARKQLCLFNVATAKDDANICERISDPRARSECIGIVGASLSNVALCDRAPQKDDCFNEYAKAKDEPAICARITDTTLREECEFFATPIDSN